MAALELFTENLLRTMDKKPLLPHSLVEGSSECMHESMISFFVFFFSIVESVGNPQCGAAYQGCVLVPEMKGSPGCSL